MNGTTLYTRPAVAVVEDDADLRESMRAYLAAREYPVWVEGSAESFYKHLLIEPVDVVILDIGLPGESGLAVARHLRVLEDIEVIILSGRSATEDRLLGLDAGADRYLVKPIDLRELVANIDACSRRPSVQAEVVTSNKCWQLLRSDWALVSPCGKRIKLTSQEWCFINCILQGNNQTASRSEIIHALCGADSAGFDFHRIDMVVLRIRQKISRITGKSAPIHTLRSHGFTFSVSCQVQ
jgi:DNA-binding response OmpR family regulator